MALPVIQLSTKPNEQNLPRPELGLDQPYGTSTEEELAELASIGKKEEDQ